MEDCLICGNSRIIVFKGEDGLIYAKPCECAAEYDFRRRIQRSGLLSMFDEYTFDKYQVRGTWQKVIKEKALSFVEEANGDWFFIGGQVGAGKTMICTAIVGELIKKGYDAHYMMYREEINKLKMGMNMDDFGEYTRFLNYLKTIKVLYIDDLFKGTSNPTEADIRVLFDLLNYRYANKGLITIISTEKSIDDILRIDEAIGSRIFQRSKNYMLKLAENRDMNYRMKP